jgi:hypothetical protein
MCSKCPCNSSSGSGIAGPVLVLLAAAVIVGSSAAIMRTLMDVLLTVAIVTMVLVAAAAVLLVRKLRRESRAVLPPRAALPEVPRLTVRAITRPRAAIEAPRSWPRAVVLDPETEARAAAARIRAGGDRG